MRGEGSKRMTEIEDDQREGEGVISAQEGTVGSGRWDLYARYPEGRVGHNDPAPAGGMSYPHSCNEKQALSPLHGI